MSSSASAPELLDLEYNREVNKRKKKKPYFFFFSEKNLCQGLPSSKPDDDSTSQSDEEHSFRNPQAVVSTEHEFLYYLSDGVYGSFNNIVFDHARPQPVLLQVGPVDQAQRQKMLTL